MLASALSVFLGVTVALASVVNVFERSDSSLTRCSTDISDEDIIAAEKDFQPNVVSQSLTERASGTVTIQVYFNVISADQTLAGGSLSFVYFVICYSEFTCLVDCLYRDASIFQQMQVLNNDFANSGLSFNLAGITRTVNADWFNNAAPLTAQQTAMKQALRKGGPADLNIYSVG
jgi:hypothetical protein